MNRKLALLTVFLVLFGFACGSMNRVAPSSVDDTAMKADVKGKIAAVDASKTFDIGVTVDSSSGTVTLTGTVDTASERQKIGDAAGSVSGVRRVINNITVR